MQEELSLVQRGDKRRRTHSSAHVVRVMSMDGVNRAESTSEDPELGTVHVHM